MSEVKLYKDGDKWCAVYEPTFINIQESPAGFGDTENEALLALIKDQVAHIQTDVLLRTLPTGTYVAKGKQYRAWVEDKDGNFPDGLDAYDAPSPAEALAKLQAKLTQSHYK